MNSENPQNLTYLIFKVIEREGGSLERERDREGEIVLRVIEREKKRQTEVLLRERERESEI